MLQRLFGGRPYDHRSAYPGSPAFAGDLPYDPASLPGLAARWWRWAGSIPSATHPVEDRTGRYAGLNQPEDVFFLAGTFGGEARRRCVVPAGLPVFFPVLNVVDQGGDGVPFFRDVELMARLNGTDLPVVPVTNEVPYLLVGLRGNPLTRSGRSRAVGSGHWCRLDPLTPGEYVLEFAGASGGFSVAVTYALTVADPTATGPTP